MAVRERKRPYRGPMAEVRGLKPEELWANMPDTVGLTRELIRDVGGWPGLVIPYSHTLTPLDLREDDFLLDVGCGVGEHIVLAGLGMPGEINPVRFAVGLSAGRDEIKYAMRLARWASNNKERFRGIVGLKVRTMIDLRDDALYFGGAEPGDMPENISFMNTNIFHLPLADNTADKTLSSSVASYIKSPLKRATMFKELLRVTREGGLINVGSYDYPKADGSITTAAEGIQDAAHKLGVVLNERPDLMALASKPKPDGKYVYTIKVFELARKPKELPAGIFRG
jgi:SAM-dependent methyltransferase